jgi:hypothetical protein
MGFMAAAEAAILAQLEPFRGLLLVLLRVVIPAFALGARHDDHHAILFLGHVPLPHNVNKTDRRSV